MKTIFASLMLLPILASPAFATDPMPAATDHGSPVTLGFETGDWKGTFTADGWGMKPDPAAVLYLDGLTLRKTPITVTRDGAANNTTCPPARKLAPASPRIKFNDNGVT